MEHEAPFTDQSDEPSSESSEIIQTELSASELAMLSGSNSRMSKAMWILGAVGTLICLITGGWRWTGGFLVGATLSSINFGLLRKGASKITSAAAETAFGNGETDTTRPTPPGVIGLAVRFVLRYALIGLSGYAIYKSSLFSVGAFCAGLFLFLGALLAEAIYELQFSLRQPK
jgi:hypothetical protein